MKPTIEFYQTKLPQVGMERCDWQDRYEVKYQDFKSRNDAIAFINRNNDVEARGHRLALELECLLMDTKDLSIQSKWWDSAMVALTEWQELDQQEHVSALGKD